MLINLVILDIVLIILVEIGVLRFTSRDTYKAVRFLVYLYMDVFIKKTILLFSVFLMVSVTAVIFWRVDASYAETKAPVSVTEIENIYDAVIKKYENEEIPLNRAEILGIIKSNKVATISVEQNLKASHNTWIAVRELLIGVLFVHLLILNLTVQIIKKPNKSN